jgi:nicotinamide phosphoribosyltransferase
MNPILMTDSYKTSHYLQDPPGTKGKFSYIEARQGDYTVFFGLQKILKDLVDNPISSQDIYQARHVLKNHGVPFNEDGFERIRRVHGGQWPVRIRAVPEGSIVPTGNALVTVETTDPELPWVASYLETQLLRVWYPTTVATRSHQIKQVIKRFLTETADDLSGLPFKLHDFGARGVSSSESAAIGGLAHLVNFQGTDTLEAIEAAREYYGAYVPGFSIPAAEHSTITAWGRDGETAAYRNMLTQFARPGAVLAVVSDSYDIYNAVSEIWGGELRQAVIDSGATVVIRPDSGDPATVCCQLARLLDVKFGSVVNSKGFKVLNHVRLIQGDGLAGPRDIEKILHELKEIGFSADNIAFGMGGGLLQQVNRDTFGFAMKCSAVYINGTWHDVYKDPVTAPGKRSKRGRLALLHTAEGYKTVAFPGARGWEDHTVDAMRTVYMNGALFDNENLATIRARAEGGAL